MNLSRIGHRPCLEIVALFGALLACGGNDAISPEGYTHEEYAYRVQATPDGKLMPDSWKLDNFREDESKAKTEGIYVTTYDLDVDGDGDVEETDEAPTYDLRFKHLEDAGVVFLRTVPVSQNRRTTKLRVLMTQFIEQVAGAGYEVVKLNQAASILVEKRYAAAVVEEGPAKLGGREAYFATIDVANLDQLRVDPNAVRERVQLVILHTGFEYDPVGNPRGHNFPVIMLAGYANQREDFARGLPEFHDFLARITINGAQGFTLAAPASNAVPAPPATPAQPSAPTAPEASTAPGAPPAPAGASPAVPSGTAAAPTPAPAPPTDPPPPAQTPPARP